jgi:AcrR family transcriptional regulator
MAAKIAERTVHLARDNSVVPPRDRILRTARELFSRDGIHGVGVEAIAEAAGTNKMTLYRHFESKDLLVAEYLRGLVAESQRMWEAIDAANPGDPLAQLADWIDRIGHHGQGGQDGGRESGCALAYATIQLTDPNHPGRKVIEQNKRDHRAQLVRLCCASGLRAPELLADQLFLLVEGSRVAYPNGETERPLCLQALAASVIAAHRV